MVTLGSFAPPVNMLTKLDIPKDANIKESSLTSTVKGFTPAFSFTLGMSKNPTVSENITTLPDILEMVMSSVLGF
jgi:hypothetical protein